MDNQFKTAVQIVINKAWEDDEFRAKMVANPKGNIHKLTGLKIPSEVDLIFNDQTDNSKTYINIPPKPNFDDMELSDEQLEIVAGGEVMFGAFTLAVALGVTAGAAVVGGAAGGAAAGIGAGW